MSSNGFKLVSIGPNWSQLVKQAPTKIKRSTKIIIKIKQAMVFTSCLFLIFSPLINLSVLLSSRIGRFSVSRIRAFFSFHKLKTKTYLMNFRFPELPAQTRGRFKKRRSRRWLWCHLPCMKVLRKMLLYLLQSWVSGSAGNEIRDQLRNQPKCWNLNFPVDTNQPMNEIDRLTKYSSMTSV